MAEPPLVLGSRVRVGGKTPLKQFGTVRFIGATQFSPGEWFGVELDEAKGKNDGTVQGIRYFECQDLYGIFVKRSLLTLDGAARSSSEPKKREKDPDRKSKKEMRSQSSRDKGSSGQHALGEEPLFAIPKAGSIDLDPRPRLGGSSLTSSLAPVSMEPLSYEAQKRHFREIEQVRKQVQSLAETVDVVQARAADVERNVSKKEEGLDPKELAEARAVAGVTGSSATAGQLGVDPRQMETWLQQIGDQLRQQMSKELARQAEGAIAQAVEKGTLDLVISQQPEQHEPRFRRGGIAAE